MARFKIDVTDVTVFPYMPGLSIPVKPILKTGVGTYTVGTHLEHAFYSLGIANAEVLGEVLPGASYYAEVTDSNGHRYELHWMKCLNVKDGFSFGLATGLLERKIAEAVIGAEKGPFYVRDELVDVKIQQQSQSKFSGAISIMDGGTGKWIASRFGTPTISGVQVEHDGETPFHIGMSAIQVIGVRSSDGHEIAYNDLICVDAGQPATFLQRIN